MNGYGYLQLAKQARRTRETMAMRAAANRRDPAHPDFEGFTDFEATMICEGEFALAGHDPQNVTEEMQVAAWQHLIDTGLAWRLQGWFGRQAMALIAAGICTR